MTATALVPRCTMYIPATMLPQVLKICSRPNGTLARAQRRTDKLPVKGEKPLWRHGDRRMYEKQQRRRMPCATGRPCRSTVRQ